MIKVLVGGCFNKIHPGHIYFLNKASLMGDKLIVVLTHDRNNKKQYAVPAKIRKKDLEKLKIADKIIIGGIKDHTAVIRKYKPDIIALGYDQKLTKEQKVLIKKMNIKIRRIRKLGKFGSKSHFGK